MRFKVDENLPAEVVELLRGAGHAADTVADEGAGGAVDSNLAALVRREGRALLTLDVGFADIRSYPPMDYQGLVFCAWAGRTRGMCFTFAHDLLQLLANQPLPGHLWIVEDNRIRVRRGEE